MGRKKDPKGTIRYGEAEIRGVVGPTPRRIWVMEGGGKGVLTAKIGHNAGQDKEKRRSILLGHGHRKTASKKTHDGEGR